MSFGCVKLSMTSNATSRSCGLAIFLLRSKIGRLFPSGRLINLRELRINCIRLIITFSCSTNVMVTKVRSIKQKIIDFSQFSQEIDVQTLIGLEHDRTVSCIIILSSFSVFF